MAQSITRLSGVNSLSGTIPATNIANSTFDNITALPSAVPTGKPVLLSTATASASSSIEFTSGIDSTYDIYKFEFINIHPETNNVKFTFQSDTGTNTNYNQTITSTDFISQHNETGTTTELGYAIANDQAQGTAFQPIGQLIGNDNDECAAGTLQVFQPSSTTYVKHFIANTNVYRHDNYSREHFTAGYFNTTSALTRFRFKMSSGNLDSGKIKMYGISA